METVRDQVAKEITHALLFSFSGSLWALMIVGIPIIKSARTA